MQCLSVNLIKNTKSLEWPKTIKLFDIEQISRVLIGNGIDPIDGRPYFLIHNRDKALQLQTLKN
jgi:hypothetical protein